MNTISVIASTSLSNTSIISIVLSWQTKAVIFLYKFCFIKWTTLRKLSGKSLSFSKLILAETANNPKPFPITVNMVFTDFQTKYFKDNTNMMNKSNTAREANTKIQKIKFKMLKSFCVANDTKSVIFSHKVDIPYSTNLNKLINPRIIATAKYMSTWTNIIAKTANNPKTLIIKLNMAFADFQTNCITDKKTLIEKEHMTREA